MIRRLFFDAKSLVKRRWFFVLLLCGMTVGAFALITYYVASTEDLKNLDAVFMTNYVIEFRTDPDIYSGDKLLALIEDDKLPEVYYADVVSYSNPDYDVFAIYYNENYDASYSGRFIGPDDMGKRNAVVTYGLQDDEIKINGNKFNVVGVVANAGYAPDIYDYRRIPNGEEYVAGVEYMRDADIADRPENGVFIPLDMIDEINALPNYYHITFKESLTDAQRSRCEEILSEAFGEGYIEFTDMTPYSEIHSFVKYVRLLIYAVAICLGLVNIIALFNYFLESNSKNYAVYKMLGASDRDIFFIISGELLLLSIVSFAVGGILSYLFVKYSGFINNHLSISVYEILILFTVYFLIAFLLGTKKIRKTSKSSAVSLNKKNTASQRGDKNVSVSNKHIYLMSFKYCKSTISGTLSLAFLSFVCAFTFVFAMSYVAESNVFGRYVSDIYDYKIGIFCGNERYSNGYLEARANNDIEFINSCKDKLLSLQGVEKVGEYTELPFFAKIGDDTIQCEFGDRTFWENSQYPLYEGSWQPLIDYNGQRTIPIVVDYTMGKRYPVGSDITIDVCIEYIEEIEGYFEDGLPYGHAYETYEPFSFTVVGILKDDVYVMAPNPDYQMGAPITHYLCSPSDIYEDGFYGMIFLPYYSIDGISPVFTDEFSRIWYVFADDNADKYVENWNIEIEDIGKIDTFGIAVRYYNENYRSGGGNTYFMHSVISALILIFGVGGYCVIIFFSMRRQFGIYYMSGMPWSYASALMVAGNAVDIMLPGLLGAVCGVFTTNLLRSFSSESNIISLLSGIALVSAIFIITSSAFVLYMQNKTPTNLINKEAQ